LICEWLGGCGHGVLFDQEIQALTNRRGAGDLENLDVLALHGYRTLPRRNLHVKILLEIALGLPKGDDLSGFFDGFEHEAQMLFGDRALDGR